MFSIYLMFIATYNYATTVPLKPVCMLWLVIVWDTCLLEQVVP